MDLSDFSDGTLWAITPQALDSMIEILPTVLQTVSSADNLDHLMVKARENAGPVELTVTDGVAMIPIRGSISKTVSFWDMIFGGGAGITRIRRDMQAALDDPKISGIVLEIDSPGGRVNGVSELAEFVFSARQIKPIVAYSDGDITSAATFIGSAASKKILSPTAHDGSIGVVTLHVDLSRALEKGGVKYTYITAGKYKAMGNPVEPLTEEARRMIEERLNMTYDVFIESMGKYRGKDADTVRSDMADGRIFVGKQAVEIGLADSLGSIEDAVDTVLEMADQQNGKHYFQYGGNSKMGPVEIKTLEQLQAAFPELCSKLSEQARAEGVKSVDLKAPVTEATQAATDRILGLAGIHFGKETADKFAGIVNEGLTVSQYQKITEAMGYQPPVLQQKKTDADADAEFKQQMLKGLENAGAGDVGAGGGNAQGPQTWEEALSVIQAEQKCSRGQAIKRAVQLYPELHQKYLDQINAKAA